MAPPRRAEKRRRASLPIPTESALAWGLLCDFLLLPLWLLGLLIGDRRARLRDGLRPLWRLHEFATAARMTTLLIALCLLVFTVEVVLRHSGVSESALLRIFALRRDDLSAGRYSVLFLHVFAHAGVSHLLGNLLALFVFGRVVESHLGPWRLLGAFLTAAASSTALSLLAQFFSPGHPTIPTLGASGAVAGLVALGVLLSPFAITFEALLPLPLFLVGWLAMTADLLALWHGAHDKVDHPAHLGGYLSVPLFYYALDAKLQRRARAGLIVNLLTAVFAIALWRLFGPR